MSQFQVKYLDEDDWQEVSETFVLEKLVGFLSDHPFVV
jgi:hypothetical protein